MRAILKLGVVVGLAAVLAGPGVVHAQTARVAVDEENFRSEPRGTVLARVFEGAELALGEVSDGWRETTLEAWIWGRSVQDRAGTLDLVVNAEGENLRASPNGTRVGRAEGGMRLERLETRGDWIRVRRTGWIWQPSLDLEQGQDEAAGGDPPGESAEEAPDVAGTRLSSTREFAVLGEGALILSDPAGDTIARVRPGGNVEVMEREGSWSRVRVEGWILTGALGAADTSAGVLRGISRDSLQSHPEQVRGRLVEWTLQFIALQEAERFRTELREGEPFLLTRGPGDDPGFVYVTVPPELAHVAGSLAPLQRIRILARVRAARSSLTGVPVLELLEITGR